MPSLYERRRAERIASLLQALDPQVEVALVNLSLLGVRTRVVGSYAQGRFGPRSDVDFLIEDAGPASDGEIYEAIASAIRVSPFDIVHLQSLEPQSRRLMLWANP